MKKIILTITMVTFCYLTYSQQWVGNNNSTDNIYRWGRVGIGTSIPQTNLHLAANSVIQMRLERIGTNVGYSDLGGWNGDFQIWAGGYSKGNSFLIKGLNGYLGIGTTNPQAPIHSAVSGNAIQLRLERLNTNSGICDLGVYNNDFRIYAGGHSVNNKFTIKGSNGYVGIGTTNPQNALDVNGTIRAKEVIVETGWADYVFKEGYNLKSLNEVENFININNHLPDVPSSKEIQLNGLSLAKTNTLLMQKIEELTLYIIAQNKRIEALENKN